MNEILKKTKEAQQHMDNAFAKLSTACRSASRLAGRGNVPDWLRELYFIQRQQSELKQSLVALEKDIAGS